MAAEPLRHPSPAPSRHPRPRPRRWSWPRSARGCSRPSAGPWPSKGYAGATIDDIVRGAGVSKKTFYEHFRDKQAASWPPTRPRASELLERVSEPRSASPGGLARAHPRRASGPTCAGWPATRAGAGVPDRGRGGRAPVALACRSGCATATPSACASYRTRASACPTRSSTRAVAAADDLVVRRLREGSDLLELEPILLRLQVAQLAGPKAAAQLA